MPLDKWWGVLPHSSCSEAKLGRMRIWHVCKAKPLLPLSDKAGAEPTAD